VESARVIAFPLPDWSGDAPEIEASALAEIDAAIALVVGRAARRVRLTAVPFVDTVLAMGLAHAHGAGIAFTVEPAGRVGVLTVTVGPARPEGST
jgi:hypothetical protein